MGAEASNPMLPQISTNTHSSVPRSCRGEGVAAAPTSPGLVGLPLYEKPVDPLARKGKLLSTKFVNVMDLEVNVI